MRTFITPFSILFALTVGCDNGDRAMPDNGALAEAKSTVDYDGDGYTEATGDCNESDVNVNPGQAEVCDGVDNDCDCGVDSDGDTNGDGTECGSGDLGVDNLDSSATETIIAANYDEDGYPAESGWIFACDEDFEAAYSDFIAAFGGDTDLLQYWGPVTTYEDTDGDSYDDTPVWDCDDQNAAIYPDAEEICDGYLNDCDAPEGSVADDGLMSTWHADSDGDTFGDAATSTEACDAPEGAVADATDCDDTRDDVNPDGTEICDDENVDEDCDGGADDSDADGDASGMTDWYTDADSDGLGVLPYVDTTCDAPAGSADNVDDCDDTDAGLGEASTWYRDSDGDLYGYTDASYTGCSAPTGYVDTNGDCDDGEATIYPGATEAYDGIDQDCDGVADDDPSCSFLLEVFDGTLNEVNATFGDGAFDGDWYAGVTGVASSATSLGGGEWYYTFMVDYCFTTAGESLDLDISFDDGTVACDTDLATGTGTVYTSQDGSSVMMTNVETDTDGDSSTDTCVLRVSAL